MADKRIQIKNKSGDKLYPAIDLSLSSNIGTLDGSKLTDASVTSSKLSGTLSLDKGGTGATTAAAARANLNVYSKAEVIKLIVGIELEENLADNTWEQIQNGLAAGNPMGWAVGDTKPLTLTNGDTYTIRLVDLQEGRYESTTGVKCHGTFEFVELLKGITRAMNSTTKTYGSNTSYTAGGWLNSDMRAYMQGDVLALIPDELKNFMLLNKVGSASYGGSGQTDTAAGGVIIYSDGDKLFLAAQSEFFSSGITFYSYNTERTAYPQFDYYVTHNTYNDRVKTQLGSTGRYYYWNRSPSYPYSFDFCIVGNDGLAYGNSAGSTNSVAPCFTL